MSDLRIFCAATDCIGGSKPGGEDGLHWGCRRRANGMQISPKATPTRSESRVRKFRPIQQPSWEAGVAGERRCDGSFMPYLGEDRELMGVKEAGERRREINTQLDRLRNDPTVFRAERDAAVHIP